MKNMLYATDCSKLDAKTLRYAYKLCDALKANLVVLHVYSIPPISVSTIRPKKQLSSSAFDEHLDIVKQYCIKHLKGNLTDTPIKIEVKEHVSVADGILVKTKELSPELLLVGMKDEHTARGIFTGSIAKKLMEKVDCPMLLVPTTKRFKKLEKLMYATDFEEGDIFAIKQLVEIAKPFGASIEIVHITTQKEYADKEQMEWFKEMLQQEVDYKKLDFQLLFFDTVFDGLRAVIKTSNPDMIALLEREERGLLKKLFHTDLVKKMESKITIPLLSYNNRNV